MSRPRDRKRDRTFPWHRHPYFGLSTVIPKPNAKISLRRAMIEYEIDGRCAAQFDLTVLPLDVLSFIGWNAAMWLRFWSKRHPNPVLRFLLSQEVEQDQADAREMMPLIERLLREQGYEEVLQ